MLVHKGLVAASLLLLGITPSQVVYAQGFAAQGFIEGTGPTLHLTLGRGGVIAAQYVAVGQTVAAGTLLAELVCPEIHADIARLQQSVVADQAALAMLQQGTRAESIAIAAAELATAQAQLKLELDRYQRLQQQQSKNPSSVAQSLVEEHQNLVRVAQARAHQAAADKALADAGPRPEEITIAQAKLAASQAGLSAAEKQLQTECQLYAPGPGQVLKWYLHPGEWVDRVLHPAVASFGDMSGLTVVAQLDEKDARRVQPGQAVSLRLAAAGGADVSGQVVSIDAEVGGKAGRSADPREPLDRDVLEARIKVLQPGLPAISGLRVVVVFNDDAD